MERDELYYEFSEYYDVLYENKDYVKEVEFLDPIFKKHKVKRVLDVACGTGKHAILLAKKGYEIKGIDISKKMLKIANEKAKKEKVAVSFEVGDMRYYNANTKYDAIICMFSSILYNTTNEDLFSTLKSFNKNLKDKGILVLHFSYPVEFKKRWENTFNKGNKEITEKTEVKYDSFNQIIHRKTTYIIKDKEKGAVIKLNPKRLPLRILLPKEIEAYLKFFGFKIINIFKEFDIKNKEEKKGQIIILAKKRRK